MPCAPRGCVATRLRRRRVCGEARLLIGAIGIHEALSCAARTAGAGMRGSTPYLWQSGMQEKG